MPLVFVHGVNVRRDGDYQTSVAARDSLFRRFALKPIGTDTSSFQIFNPYWGGDAAKFAWNQASLPKDQTEAFGGQDELVCSLLIEAPYAAGHEQSRKWLLETARRSGLADAIDMLWSAAAYSGKESTSDQLARLAQRAVEYADANPKPAWLNEVEDDEEFLDRLAQELRPAQASVQEAFGSDFMDRLREAADRIALAAGRATSAGILKLGRNSLNSFLATFMGDIVTYVANRGTVGRPGLIVSRILDDLDAAAAIARNTGEPLIIVAHSMGGNIVYDILSYFRPDLIVEALITVGSQVGLFEELKIFGLCRLDVPTQKDPRKLKMPKPPGLKHWLNVFDFEDVLGYAAAEIFEGAQDYPYSTGNGLLFAHIRYFTRPSFHARLGARLAEIWK